MKTSSLIHALLLGAASLCLCQCERPATRTGTGGGSPEAPAGAGQSGVVDDVSQRDIVKVAAASQEHTTLVAAVKAADLVDALSNAGPFTVFAPTNAAFDKLPAGTVDSLLKPENKDKLDDILQYHVALATYRPDMLRDGMTLNMANSGNVKVTVADGTITLNGSATVTGTVDAANGIVHVIDGVLLPPEAE